MASIDVRGDLYKMQVELATPVNYQLPLGESLILLNPYLGQKICLSYQGQIHCVHCGRLTKKSFNQGYCYPCLTRLAQCDRCIVSPETCHYDAGTCREPAWGEQHCMRQHYVYLANSSGLKVGITRAENIPSRWIDQGAIQALPILVVASRYQSGLAEVLFKQHIADKTNWRTMLKGQLDELDLIGARDDLLERLAPEISTLQERFGLQAIQACGVEKQAEIEYPVLEYPVKVTPLNFEKTPLIEGTLLGIKGQYLILDTGVLNIRKFSGYQVSFVA
ncbi:MAG: DUF2797 domain-containing protein [Pseudomonadales bacterium]|nr:DUF2797 domain-containing protein [Pseudomonadales bacterium]